MSVLENVTYLSKYYNYFYIFVLVVCMFCYASNSVVYAHQEEPNVTLTDIGSFTDAMGIKNIVGTVQNNNDIPIKTAIGINTTTDDGKTAPPLVTEPYGKVIYPYSEAPFKLKLSSDLKPIGKPFVYQARNVNIPHYDVIRLNYTNTPTQNGSLTGSVKNIASFDVYNLTIYASAHSQNGAQVDSVRSHLIPVLRSGERVMFTVSPDVAIRPKVSFYSCFGVDFSTTNMKIKIGENRYITSNMTGLATISNIKADPSTGSILIDINNQYPVPGPLTLKIPQIFSSPTIFVRMDGTLYKNAVTVMKGYTYVDLSIPAGKHEVTVSGIG
jgi:hypothetical protein